MRTTRRNPPASDQLAVPRGFRRTFQALAVRNYRLFFVGQIVSVTGSWMQKVVQDWLILQLGGGPLELAGGVALQSVPSLILGVWGGLLVDRVGHTRRILMATQVLQAGLAVLLGARILTHNVSLSVVYICALLVGCVSTVDTPARQTFVLDMVGADQAANAVSLNSSINSSARLIGPGIGGMLIGLLGTGPTYLLNAATFAAIIGSLVMMDSSKLHPRVPIKRQRGQVRSGIRYSIGDDVIRTSLLTTFVISLFAQNFRVILPLVAATDFGGGARGYGWLMSGLGAGALAGALICAHLARPSLPLIGWELVLFGTLVLAAAAAPTYVVMVVLIVGVGAGNTSFNTTSNALVLLRSKPELRGRVFSIRTLLSRGATPLGSLGIGWVCEVTDPRIGLVVGGVASVSSAALTIRRRRTRSADGDLADAPELERATPRHPVPTIDEP